MITNAVDMPMYIALMKTSGRLIDSRSPFSTSLEDEVQAVFPTSESGGVPAVAVCTPSIGGTGGPGDGDLGSLVVEALREEYTENSCGLLLPDVNKFGIELPQT